MSFIRIMSHPTSSSELCIFIEWIIYTYLGHPLCTSNIFKLWTGNSFIVPVTASSKYCSHMILCGPWENDNMYKNNHGIETIPWCFKTILKFNIPRSNSVIKTWSWLPQSNQYLFTLVTFATVSLGSKLRNTIKNWP